MPPGLIRRYDDTHVIGVHRSLLIRVLLPSRLRVPQRRHGRWDVRRVPQDLQCRVLLSSGLGLGNPARVCERLLLSGGGRLGPSDLYPGVLLRARIEHYHAECM